MPEKPFRYPSPEASELAVSLYRFESSRVAGPGSSNRDINDILWTRGEAVSALGLDKSGEWLLDELMKSLFEQRQLMVVPEWKGEEEGHVTRTAETIRLMGHSYEYWRRG